MCLPSSTMGVLVSDHTWDACIAIDDILAMSRDGVIATCSLGNKIRHENVGFTFATVDQSL